MEQTQIDLPKPSSNKIITSTNTQIGYTILQYLLENRLSNIHSIEKGLEEIRPRLSYSTIRKTIYGQLRSSVLYHERQQKRNATQKTKLFILSKEGYESLLTHLYSEEFKGSNKKRVNLISIALSQMNDYSLILWPPLFEQLPKEYGIILYPYFEAYPSIDEWIVIKRDRLSKAIFSLLEAKAKRINQSDFLVDNGVFSSTISITIEEATLLADYLKKRLEKTEAFLSAKIKSFNQKKQILEELRVIFQKNESTFF